MHNTDTSWIDISMTLQNRMAHWPGDPVPYFESIAAMQDGDPANVTAIAMSAHTGTHIDAPLHYCSGGASIGQMPFEATVGKARVIHVPTSGAISRADLARHDPAPGERLLIRTQNSDRLRNCRYFLKHFAHLTPDAASLLVEAQVRTVGVDYLSVGAYEGESGGETHRILLGEGIWIIEGLVLAAADAGEYELLCLPLKMAAAEGAPARAVLRPLQ